MAQLSADYAAIPSSSSDVGSRPVSRASNMSSTLGSRSNSRRYFAIDLTLSFDDDGRGRKADVLCIHFGRPARRRKSTSNPHKGEASFASSVINLLNTSMLTAKNAITSRRMEH